MANYNDALEAWGAKRLASTYVIDTAQIKPGTVKVEMVFEEGYTCCGGGNPDCYCSLAESPSANVLITAHMFDGTDGLVRHIRTEIPATEFDFASVLKEIVEAGDGIVSL